MKYLDDLLNDLVHIVHAHGIYVGKWEDEYNRESSVESFLNLMKDYADEYNLRYDKDLEHYREFEEDGKVELYDRLSYEIYTSLINHIKKRILK